MSRAVRYAQSVLQRYWDRKIPVDPKAMIEQIDDLQLEYQKLDDNISGKVYYDFDRKTYVIIVNQNHHENRQRFTIAHELGHYALGHGTKEDVLYRDGSSDPHEVEANDFAAEILMPKSAVHYLVFDKDISSIKELAHRFWVSEQAMIFRLKNLGLVS